MTEPTPGKRLSLAELKAHPWLQGPILAPTQLSAVLQKRLAFCAQVTKREVQAKAAKRKSEAGTHKQQQPIDLFIEKKGAHDRLASHFLEECAAINSTLELLLKAKEDKVDFPPAPSSSPSPHETNEN